MRGCVFVIPSTKAKRGGRVGAWAGAGGRDHATGGWHRIYRGLHSELEPVKGRKVGSAVGFFRFFRRDSQDLGNGGGSLAWLACSGLRVPEMDSLKSMKLFKPAQACSHSWPR